MLASHFFAEKRVISIYVPLQSPEIAVLLPDQILGHVKSDDSLSKAYWTEYCWRPS